VTDEAPTRIAHFRILGPLGQGGMGVVYRAEDETLRRTVALKLLPDASGNEERRQRFLREARSAAAITHPNVATVYQVGEAEGRVYIAMELVPGENLRERMGRGRLELATAAAFADQIARGLAAAHEHGIVHRDLKPENVMITPSGLVKLLDFGLAKVGVERPASGRTEAALAKTETVVTSDEGRIMGTPEYMSPEQALGEPLDVRSDVFSMGIILYEMLSGARPFGGTTTGALLVAIARDAAPPLRQRAPEVDEATEAIVMRCLAKAPAERFASAGEIVAALSGASPRASTVSQTEAPAITRSGGVKSGASRVPIVLAVVAAVLIAGAAGWSFLERGRRSAAPAPSTSGSEVASVTSSASGVAPVPVYVERRLTHVPSDDLVDDAALTPDGQALVFCDSIGLWIQPLAGGPRRRLAGSSALGTNLSIDGFRDEMHVLVAGTGGAGTQIWRVPLDGGPAVLVRDLPAELTAVTEDESLIAWKQDATLRVGPLDGGPSTVLPASKLAGFDFSPDGRRLAIAEMGQDWISIVAADGSAQSRVPLGGPLSAGLQWDQPRRILFTRYFGKSGHCALFELPLDAEGHASSPRELWRTPATWLGGVSSVGGRYSVVVTNQHREIYVADLSPGDRRLLGAPRAFAHGKNDSHDPAWLDGERLAFWSDRDDQSAVYEQTSASAEPTLRLPWVMRWPRLEPVRGGNLIAAMPAGSADAGASRLVVIGPGGSERELRRATTAGGDAIRCGDGASTRCVLGWTQDHALWLSRIDLDTGVVSNPPLFKGKDEGKFAVSPDGKLVALVEGSPSVVLVDVATGQSRSVTTSPGNADTILQEVDFSPDGQTLVISGMHFRSAQYGIIAVGLDGRGALLRTTAAEWMFSPRVSPDGRHLAFGNMTLDSDVWLLEPR
jgi:dipeptidyl aminopeptidase/acylaminoacyl peptidase